MRWTIYIHKVGDLGSTLAKDFVLCKPTLADELNTDVTEIVRLPREFDTDLTLNNDSLTKCIDNADIFTENYIENVTEVKKYDRDMCVFNLTYEFTLQKLNCTLPINR